MDKSHARRKIWHFPSSDIDFISQHITSRKYNARVNNFQSLAWSAKHIFLHTYIITNCEITCVICVIWDHNRMSIPTVQIILVLFNRLLATSQSYTTCHTKIDYNLTGTNETYKSVFCEHSYCCQNGCCDSYINATIVIFVILIIVCFGICLDACWRKHFKKESHSIDGEAQENLVLSSYNPYDDSLKEAFYGSVAKEKAESSDAKEVRKSLEY